MSVAMAGFTCNDALSKMILPEMSIGQMMLVRGIFATAMVLVIGWYSGALRRPALLFHPMILVRMFCEAAAAVFFLLGLARMPLANITAVMQALPLAVTLGAAFFFHEPVGWKRWIAISLGFVGVVLIVRPGTEGFSAYSLYALACVAFCMVRDLATKQVPTDIPTMLISLGTACLVMLLGGGMAVLEGGWSPMTPSTIVILMTAAALLMVGHQAVIHALRSSDISFVAPFRYTSLLWALMLGYLLFGDFPAMLTIVGAAIIVASGLFTLYRETVVDATRPVTATTKDAGTPDGL